ncbi:MAG: hypothetical protein HFF03_01175 [Oscillospiraceae bacterium]|jgi:hypothetical protein|nr:hypothetical protein [Oscillospiraceae bacterium]
MKNRVSLDDNSYDPSEQTPTNAKGGKSNEVLSVLSIIITLIILINHFLVVSKPTTGPQYYIAQIPSEVGKASFDWTGVIDGYIHKDKECCQSVVTYWNSAGGAAGSDLAAEVVKISPDSTAYKNYKGQSVSYKVALSYCPLCRGY